MADRAASPPRAVANHDGPSAATGERVSPPTRELAQRLSGTIEILLLWHPEIDRVELCVREPATDAGFNVAVAPADAIDAFHHPYAYAARYENSHRAHLDRTTIVDG